VAISWLRTGFTRWRRFSIARLVREDTLCQESLSDAERRHWNLLTDLKA
jgi:hypothetical protein